MRTARLVAVVLVGLGAVVYSAWLLEFFLPTGVSPSQQPAGDLLLVQPLFRVTVGVAGFAFVLAGPPLMRLAPVHWTGRLTASSVAVVGLTLIADSLVPGTSVVELLTNLAFVAGSLSLALWWPPGWREWAVAGCASMLVTWALVFVSAQLGPGHYAGVFSRVQLGVRAVLLIVGIAYVVVMPVPRFAARSHH